MLGVQDAAECEWLPACSKRALDGARGFNVVSSKGVRCAV